LPKKFFVGTDFEVSGVGRRYQIRLHFILRKAVTPDGIFCP